MIDVELRMWMIELAALSALLVVGAIQASDETGAARNTSGGDWRIIFYTGNKLWAGTDSDLYVELIGSNGNSNIIRLSPQSSQLEVDGIDDFILGNLQGRDIGKLKSIVIAKKHSYAFFNDWELVKAEVVDPNGRKYVFKCNCWLTTLKYKRLIDVTEVIGERSSGLESLSMGGRHTRVFPLTITVLFLLLVLITFTYFGNEICKKWRESFLLFTSPSARTGQTSMSSHRAGGGSSRNPTRGVDSGLPRDVEQASNVLLTPNIQLTSIIEDKPPDYKILFPHESQSNTQPMLAQTDLGTRAVVPSVVVVDEPSSPQSPTNQTPNVVTNDTTSQNKLTTV